MPYIDQQSRSELLYDLRNPTTAGELNFVFTNIINTYFKTKGLNYQAINDAIGALEGCKLELYRRTAAPYEDVKIKENGDV
jgi:hypothetical protein